MNLGRNESCKCGSGKKYKKCCLINEGLRKSDELSYRRYREIEVKLVKALFLHAGEYFGPNAIDEAWAEFYLWENDKGFDPHNPMFQIFGPYFLFNWEIDPVETDCKLDRIDKTVAESFIEARRARLSADELEILTASNRRTFTFYQIMSINPGHSFRLRNVLTETEYDVTEHLATQDTKRGDIIFGAHFSAFGRNQILGTAPISLPPIALQPLTEIRRDLQKELKLEYLTDENIAEYDMELRDVYFGLLEPLLNPQLPELLNTDGDPLIPQTLHFTISSPEIAFQALKFLTAGVISDKDLLAHAKLKNQILHEVNIPWHKKGKVISGPGSPTVLATIRIVGKKLIVEVNSNKRANAIKKKIETALGSEVRFVTKVIESIEGNINRKSDQNRPSSNVIPFDQLPPEALEAAKKMAENHWKTWFDMKIPALNGMTPKKAAKSKEGRELLEALLYSYEQRPNAKTNDVMNIFQPDICELRRQLKLD